MSDDVKAVLAFFESQKAERDPWDPLFQEAADFLLPHKAAFTSKVVKGENRFDELYDDTGTWALEQFANGIHSYMTSPLVRWAGLQIKEKDLRDDPDVMAWRDYAVDVLYDQFNASHSSFHPTLQEIYLDLGAFGYGVGFSEWSEKDQAVLFQSRFPGEIYLIEDQYGRVRGLNRIYKLKAHQFVEAFGIEKMPQSDRDIFEKTGGGREFEIVHSVLPSDHPVMKRFKIAKKFKYGSVRVCRDKTENNEPLAVGGFKSFPFHVARWGKRAGEVYSTSPGINALPSVRRANAIQLDLIKIANRFADPPTQGPDDEALSPYDMSPGAQNYFRPGTNDRIEGINGVFGDPNFANTILEKAEQSIVRSFFVDAFLTTADSNGQNVKATFVNQRRDERFRQLAAMLSRVERELLGSYIERTFELAQENGKIPPAPQGVTLEIEFLSPITRAQRSEQLDGMFSLVELAGLGAQFDPTVMNSFKWGEIIKHAGDKVYSLPSAWFKSQEELEQEQQEEAARQQMLEATQLAQGLGGAVKDVADADLSQRR